MKTIAIDFCLIILASDAIAEAPSAPEDVANAILQDRLAITPRVGASTNSIFLREFDVHLYLTALTTQDKKLKALIAIKALKEMPIVLKPGQTPPSDAERITRTEGNRDFQVLKKWYDELLIQEQNNENNASNKAFQAIGDKSPQPER